MFCAVQFQLRKTFSDNTQRFTELFSDHILILNTSCIADGLREERRNAVKTWKTGEVSPPFQRPSSHLLNVLNALDDVVAFHRLFHSVGVAQDAQVLLQGLLHQAGGQRGEVGQLPQHLQYLVGNTQTHTQRNLKQSRAGLIGWRGGDGDRPSQSWSRNEPLCRSSRSD